MKRKTILALIFVLGAAVAAFLLPALVGPRAQAQQACTEFHAILQAALPSPHPLQQSDTWGGDVYGTLGGEFVSGIVSGNDGNDSWHGVSGTGRNGSYTFVFGTDSFTMEVNAAFPGPVGKGGLGEYKGEGKVVQGTGRFVNASGNINWAGPFIVWSPDGEHFYGRWNAEIRGNICGIQ